MNIGSVLKKKNQESSKSRFGGSEKDRYFLKIPKWQYKLIRDYKRGKFIWAQTLREH